MLILKYHLSTPTNESSIAFHKTKARTVPYRTVLIFKILRDKKIDRATLSQGLIAISLVSNLSSIYL